MKKTLRSLALAALALPLIASAEITMTTVWMNGVADGQANPIPGLDAGWNKPTPTHVSTSTCSRFGIGKDGSILTTDHKKNAIVAWDGKSMTTFKQLPPVTADKWNGTALATDDAGNVIFNFNFTDADKSLQNWGVIGKDGNITEVTLSTPMSEFTGHGRIDIISHIVGDVTSAKGGIGYATNKESGRIIMFHFKGDGSKVTSLTAKMSQEVQYLKAYSTPYQIETWCAYPKFDTVDDLLKGTPEDNFYLPLGWNRPDELNGLPKIANGMIANFDNGYFSPLMGIGNRGFHSVATLNLDGKKYFVRSYVSDNNPLATTLSDWNNVMAFGLFDESGNCVATWDDCDFMDGNGSLTYTVEPIDEKNVNLYMFVGTVTPKIDKGPNETGTICGCYAAMIKISTESKGSGTKEDPYTVATADDLCNAWKKTVKGQIVYFKQTADIDMEGITNYTALCGFESEYDKSIYYDGGNHVIKNFAPVDRIAGQGENAYYCTTIFGTPSGTIKNLGVVDAQINTSWYEAGILGGFAGTAAHTATTETVIDNVFVTGTVDATAEGALAGGMFGTSGQKTTIKNSYAQVIVNGKSFAGGLIGKVRANQWSPEHNFAFENAYVSATVTGASGTTSLVANVPTDEWKATMSAKDVIAFGTGQASNVANLTGVTVAAPNDAAAIAKIKTWAAFNAGNMFNGLPALNWQGGASSGIEDFEVETSDAPAVYYNLQGVEVKNPESGIYIVRRGNKVTKELIR